MPKAEQSKELTVPILLNSDRGIGELRKATPKGLDPERIARVALTSWKNSADLQRCNPLSFMSAVMQSAQLGLEPNNVIGQAYLIPYGKECQLVIGYKGLIHLAHRSPDVLMVEGHAVRKGDIFAFEYGSNGYVKHIPKIEDAPEQTADEFDRKDIRCFWAGIQLRGGAYKFQVMSSRDIWDIEKRYVKAKGGPWKTNYAEMGIKTVLRRLLKQVPLTVELADAVAVDEASERGESAPLDMGAAEIVTLEGTISAEQLEELKKLCNNHEAGEALDNWMSGNGYGFMSDIPMSRLEEAKEACK